MFEVLSDKLQTAFRRLGSRGAISEKDLDEALREVRLALLEADVHFRVVRDFISHVREQALGRKVLQSLTPAQQIMAAVHDELVHTLGDGQSGISLASQPPTVIMLVGLKGAGKTTTAAKLALNLRRGGQKPLLVAADDQRLAAAEQLASLGAALDVPVYAAGAKSRSVEAAKGGLAEARRIGASVVVVDTAGYAGFSPEARQELADIYGVLKPQEALLVADAMTGQEAVRAAEEFNQATPLTGIVLTKLDGDARGGAALSVRAVTGVPIKFVGTGEKSDALETFHPDRFASRILGMGDIATLAERAKEAMAEQDTESLARRMKKGAWTLEDFQEQLNQVRKMGPLSQVMQLIPGFSSLRNKAPASVDEGMLGKAEAIIYSMTIQERRTPDIIDGSRRKRIARGSGATPHDVNQLLKQYFETKRLMKMVSSGKKMKLPNQWLQGV